MNTLLKLPEVLSATRLSRSRLYDLVEKGEFPRPVKIGLRAVAWVGAEVQAWIEARMAERELAA